MAAPSYDEAAVAEYAAQLERMLTQAFGASPEMLLHGADQQDQMADFFAGVFDARQLGEAFAAAFIARHRVDARAVEGFRATAGLLRLRAASLFAAGLGLADPEGWELAPLELNYDAAQAWAQGRETVMLSSGNTLVRKPPDPR